MTAIVLAESSCWGRSCPFGRTARPDATRLGASRAPVRSHELWTWKESTAPPSCRLMRPGDARLEIAAILPSAGLAGGEDENQPGHRRPAIMPGAAAASPG